MKTKLIIFLLLFSALARADYSGTCGNSLNWYLNTTDSTLTISGSGEMTRYDYSDVIVLRPAPHRAPSSTDQVTAVRTPWDSYTSAIAHVVIESGVTTIGSYAFLSCNKLRDISLPNTLEIIYGFAFYGCSSLESIVIPGSVYGLGNWIFNGCSKLKTVSLSPNCRYVTSYMFTGCSALRSISLPESVQFVETAAFSSCTSLSYIICHNPVPPQIESGSFNNVPTSTPLYVPSSSVSAYTAASYWNSFQIRPLLVDVDSITQNTSELSWLPVENAAQYRLRIFSDHISLDTTLIVNADPQNGGVLLSSSAPSRIQHVVLDDIGSVVIITINPNTGCAAYDPFIVTVTTSSTNKIDVRYDMQVYGSTNNLIRQEQGIFTLNDQAVSYEIDAASALEDVIVNDFATKFMNNGQVRILTPKGVYDVNGRMLNY